MLPIDWYILITPFFILIILLTLITLKLALKSQPEINSSMMKKLKIQQRSKTQNQQLSLSLSLSQKYHTLKILKYLIRNHTFLQICLQKKYKNKLTILLSISLISALCIIHPSLAINSIIGIPIVLIFIIAQLCFQHEQPSTSIMDRQIQDFSYLRQQVKNQQNTSKKYKILYTVYSVLGVGIGLLLCGLTFKNYSNLYLSTLMKNILISICGDIFVLRFIGFVLLSFPMSFSRKMMVYIENQKLKDIYQIFVQNQRNNVKNCATNNLSPRKQSNSPTKIPKAFLKLNRQNSQNQTLKSAIQMARKFKQQNLGQQSIIRTLNKNQIINQQIIQQHNSINSLFDQMNNRNSNININRNQPHTPINNYKDEQQIQIKTKRKQSDLVIVQFKKNYQHENQDEHQYQNQHQQNNEQQQQNGIRRRNGTFIHSNLDYQDTNTNINKRNNNSKITQQNNRQILKYINNQQEIIIDSQQQDKDKNKTRNRNNKNSKKHQNSITLNLDRLHIQQNQNKDGRQIQQLDTNSPQRRRARIGAGENQLDDSQYKLKKKSKHFNGNAKRRVIKFTSGQPYLEYLPNMLSKDNKHKKSQPIATAKHDLQAYEDKRKSLKKTKTKKQPRFAYGGDENQYPGTLEVEDL